MCEISNVYILKLLQAKLTTQPGLRTPGLNYSHSDVSYSAAEAILERHRL